MKKWMVTLTVIFSFCIAAIYIFIPQRIKISKAMLINCTVSGANRSLQQNSEWHKWLPDNKSEDDGLFYNGYRYYPTEQFYNKYHVNIQSGSTAVKSILHLLPHKDSTQLYWEAEIETGLNPISKIIAYRKAILLKENMTAVTIHLKSFLENTALVYGFKIEKGTVPSTYLLAVNARFNHYPKTEDIYQLTNKLEAYASKMKAEVTAKPMVNITATVEPQFQMMVGLPVDRALPVDGNIFIKRIVTANVLTAKVKGGSYTTRSAVDALYLYLQDHQLVSPAIPFELLITDRIKETDTTKWETQVYLPIF